MGLIFKDKKEREMKHITTTNVLVANNMIDICTDACSVCWDKPVPQDFNKRVSYIEARIKTGHESIIEHSNLVIYITADIRRLDDVAKVLAHSKYMNVSEIAIKEDVIHLVIGGSIRAYKELLRNIPDFNNNILRNIIKVLYENTSKAFYYDLIKDEILDGDKFIDLQENPYRTYNDFVKSSRIEIVNSDKIIVDVDDFLNTIIEIFGMNIIDRMITTTIIFKNISRAATHQLVRHRNAITQESQRYVDYTDASFIPPSKDKDKYDDMKYTVKTLGIKDKSLNDIGNKMINIYEELKEQGLLKEDARAFLPTNVACGKLYMTFTGKSLAKFLQLRTDKHAQAEIRAYANEIQSIISLFEDDIEEILLPVYKIEYKKVNYDNIDEIVDDKVDEEILYTKDNTDIED